MSTQAEILSVDLNEIVAILPADMPVGGADFYIHRGASISEPFPVRTVRASFGASMSKLKGLSQEAIAFNGWPSNGSPPNSVSESVQPGQTITIRGTGLGAKPDPNLWIEVGGKRVPHRSLCGAQRQSGLRRDRVRGSPSTRRRAARSRASADRAHARQQSRHNRDPSRRRGLYGWHWLDHSAADSPRRALG
ncbi:MAG: hypothetical protein WDO18_17655 [Acidobacteriota bacterium]